MASLIISESTFSRKLTIAHPAEKGGDFFILRQEFAALRRKFKHLFEGGVSMRRLFALVLVFLFSFCTVATAETAADIDLSAMSLDELSELHKAVDAEIDVRIGCDQSTLPAGIYAVGEGIKAGKYNLFTSEEHYGITVATFASMEKYEQAMAEQDESLIMFQCYLSQGDTVFVQLEDGMVLLVSDTALIEEANADWIP